MPQRDDQTLNAGSWGMLRTVVMQLKERIDMLDRQSTWHVELTDAKFVTFRTLVDSQAEKVGLALASADKAVTKSEESINARLEAMNEFRGALNDASKHNVSRTEFDQMRTDMSQRITAMTNTYNEKLADIQTRLDKAEGRSGGFSGAWAIATGAISVIVILVNLAIYLVGQ